MESPLLTIREIKRQHFPTVALHRIKYALEVREIEPRQRAGIVRLFGEDQIPDIADAVKYIAEGRGRGNG